MILPLTKVMVKMKLSIMKGMLIISVPINYCTCMLSCFSCVRLFVMLWIACQLFGPWDSPGKNTGVGCCPLLQGIFLTQDLNHISYVFCIRRQPLGKLNYCTGKFKFWKSGSVCFSKVKGGKYCL